MKLEKLFKPAVLSVLLTSLFATSFAQADSYDEDGYKNQQQQQQRGWFDDDDDDDDRYGDDDDDDDDRYGDDDDDDRGDWGDNWGGDDWDDGFDDDNQRDVFTDKITLKEAIAQAEERVGGFAKDGDRDIESRYKTEYEITVVKSNGDEWNVFFNARTGAYTHQYKEWDVDWEERAENKAFYTKVSNGLFKSGVEAVAEAELRSGASWRAVNFDFEAKGTALYYARYDVELSNKYGTERDIRVNAKK